MYLTAARHLLRVFFTGSCKRPREGNWLIGLAMFGLASSRCSPAPVLEWDQGGFEALGHNIEVAELLGGAGLWFSPDFSSRISILVRLCGANVVIIPELILVLITWHALLVKRRHISPHPALTVDNEADQAPSNAFSEPFTHHLRRIAAPGLVLIGLLEILAALRPPVVGPEPVEGIEVTRPPWNFWWMFTLENWWGLPSIAYGVAHSSSCSSRFASPGVLTGLSVAASGLVLLGTITLAARILVALERERRRATK